MEEKREIITLNFISTPSPMTTPVKRIVAKVEFNGIRYSHASYLIAELGADVLTVSKRLGHSSPAVTLRYYAHMFDRNDELIADKMVGSMDLTPSKQSQVKFNGNQVVFY